MKTVVIDTIDNAYKFCTDYIVKKYKIEHELDLGYGKGYALVNNGNLGAEIQTPRRDRQIDLALSLGWKRERLYGVGNGRLFSPNRGLVSFLKEGDCLGAVTLQSIEIIGPPPSEVRQHFYNPDVDQPWIRRIAPAATG